MSIAKLDIDLLVPPAVISEFEGEAQVSVYLKHRSVNRNCDGCVCVTHVSNMTFTYLFLFVGQDILRHSSPLSPHLLLTGCLKR